MEETEIIIQDFNNTLETLVLSVHTIQPFQVMGMKVKSETISEVFKKKEYFDKFIDYFVLEALPYKNNIETFFINSKLRQDTEYSTYNKLIGDLITLKPVWPKLNKTNKETVILYMNVLCDLSQIYYEKILLSI